MHLTAMRFHAIDWFAVAIILRHLTNSFQNLTSRGFMHLTATSLSCQRPRHVSPAGGGQRIGWLTVTTGTYLNCQCAAAHSTQPTTVRWRSMRRTATAPIGTVIEW